MSDYPAALSSALGGTGDRTGAETKMTIDERVQAGMTLLDEIRPGWERQINLSVLDLSDCAVCIVGQLIGNEYDADLGLFALVREDAYLDESWPPDLGFNITGDDPSYESLTSAWYHAIRARLSAAGSVEAGQP